MREATPDRRATLELGNPHPREGSKLPTNRWPTEEKIPGFREFMERWWDECSRLSYSLQPSIAQALNLPDPMVITSQHRLNAALMTLAYYPGTTVDQSQSRNRRALNAHTDYEQLTLLFLDEVGGLEVFDGQAFRPVHPKPGAVVLIVGDMLERQTNGRWKSALHQVVPPADETRDRYAMAYSSTPDPDCVITIFPGCETKGQWKPAMIGDWGDSMTTREWFVKRMANEY